MKSTITKNGWKALALTGIGIIVGLGTYLLGLAMGWNLAQYTIVLIPILIAVYVNHALVSPYLEPLPRSDAPRRDIVFVIIVYAVHFILVTINNFIQFVYGSDADIIRSILLRQYLPSVPFVALIAIYLIKHDKWTAKDFGFTRKLQNGKNLILPLLLVGIIAAVTVISTPLVPNPAPGTLTLYLVLSIYTAPFKEEFIYRAVIQTKLEKAMGTTKGWFYAGILFGLVHIPIRFLNPTITGIPAGDFLQSTLSIVNTIGFGWLAGILYAKTRNLFFPFLFHYLNNHLMDIIILTISTL